MSSDLYTCIATICNFPTLYKAEDKAPIKIVKESGYEKFFNDITVESIASYLTKHENIIETWIQFSEDIRHNPAWGFGRNHDGKWQVVYSNDGRIIESFSFDKGTDACAKMIKETIERIGK